MVSSSFVGYATMICTPQRLELYYFQKEKKKHQHFLIATQETQWKRGTKKLDQLLVEEIVRPHRQGV